MSETKPGVSSSPQTPHKTPNECFLCGRRESGAWHYSANLGRFVCEECYRRAMSSPCPPPVRT